LAEADDLPRFQDSLGHLFAVDEGAIGGVEIVDDDIVTAREDFAVMAGNGGLGQGKGIILKAPNGDFLAFELVSKPGEPFAEHNKSGHRLVGRPYYPRQLL
jgi:hypothetical protein